jgi:uncharacterized protein
MTIRFQQIVKNFAISLLALGASFLPSTKIFALESYPAQSTEFYVNDLANVISTTNEEYIISTNKALREKTGGQIVVMTVDNLQGESIETYAHGVFEQYGIGSSERNNGTLILLSVGDRQSRIEVGRGTEGFITDAESGRIQDNYMIPDFKNDNWNDGLYKGFNAVLAHYEKEYETEISENAVFEEEQEISNGELVFDGSIIAFGYILGAILRGNRKLRKKLPYILAIGFPLGIITASVWDFPGHQNIALFCFGVFIGAVVDFTGLGMGMMMGGHGGSSFGGSSGGGSSGGGGHSSGGGSSRSFLRQENTDPFRGRFL